MTLVNGIIEKTFEEQIAEGKTQASMQMFVIFISSGKVKATGTPYEVHANPTNIGISYKDRTVLFSVEDMVRETIGIVESRG